MLERAEGAAHDSSQMEYAPLHIEISGDEQAVEEAPERKAPETGIFNTILNFFDLNPKP